MVTPAARRQAVGELVKAGVSQRRAAGLVGVSRGTVRYGPRRDVAGEVLAGRMRQLAFENVHYGFRRIEALLRREGLRDNHKRMHRIWKQEGLSLSRRRHRKRMRAAGAVMRRAEHPNHVWSYDFIEDKTLRGRKIRILNILDEYTREHLWMVVERSIKATDVVEALEWLFVTRGVPGHIRSDNGPEFVAKAVKGWLEANKVDTIYIEPGSPWENAYIESFHDKMRGECLRASEFETVAAARAEVWQWREDYNQRRPHSSLGYLTPAEYAAQAARSPRPTASAPLQPEDLDVTPTLAVV